jgi:hypothetical protein
MLALGKYLARHGRDAYLGVQLGNHRTRCRFVGGRDREMFQASLSSASVRKDRLSDTLIAAPSPMSVTASVIGRHSGRTAEAGGP